jgi:hypothetical protein
MKAITTASSPRIKIIVLAVLILAALPVVYYGVPIGQDWIQFFKPATLALVRGGNPYDVLNFHNAPWTLIPFIPFALMPTRLGSAGFFLLGLACFLYVAYKLSGKPLIMILFITSYPVFSCLNGGGIDWLPMLSFVTPAPVSLIFAAMKPQIGFGIGVYWLIESWRLGGIRTVVKNFLPVTLLLLASFFIYGFWIMTFVGKSQNTVNTVNVSLFPYTLPVAFYLLWVAMTKRRARPAMAASPFFAPYHTLFSLAAPLVALFEYPVLLAIASAVLWVHGVFRAIILG